MYYDAHTHLNSPELIDSTDRYIQNFIDSGGKGMVVVGASDEYNLNSIKILQNHKLLIENLVLKFTLGLHPEVLLERNKHKTKSINQEFESLKNLILNNREGLVAIGECGIDLYYPGSEEILDQQKELFALQCDLAQKLNFPLVIHSRNGFDETMDVLSLYKNLCVYFHCRGYGPEEIKKLRKFGLKNLYVGFCGNVTYKRADDLRESLKLVGENQLLLETDAPYLSPQIVRGTQNEPANVKYIYEYVIEFLGKSKDELCKQVEKNFKNFYGI